MTASSKLEKHRNARDLAALACMLLGYLRVSFAPQVRGQDGAADADIIRALDLLDVAGDALAQLEAEIGGDWTRAENGFLIEWNGFNYASSLRAVTQTVQNVRFDMESAYRDETPPSRGKVYRIIFKAIGDENLSDLSEAVEAAYRAVEKAIGAPESRLQVDLAKLTICLDGVVYDVVSERALRWVKVLSEHPGEWISGNGLQTYDAELTGVRTDRLHSSLPHQVLDLVESSAAKGSRLRLA